MSLGTLSKYLSNILFSAVLLISVLSVSVCTPTISVCALSFTSAFSVVAFAFCACVNIPFCPVNIAIDTPANINNTIIVITNAIRVIPFLSFRFNFICSFLLSVNF